jgi:hypothetical protein
MGKSPWHLDWSGAHAKEILGIGDWGPGPAEYGWACVFLIERCYRAPEVAGMHQPESSP